MPENPSDVPASGHDELAPVADPAHAAPLTPPTSSPSAPAPRLRDRVFRFRSVIAVAAAGVIVGGAVGAGLTALVDGPDDGRPPLGRNGFSPGQAPGMSGEMPGMPGGQGFPGGGQGMPGQQGQGFPGQQGQQPSTQPSQGQSGSMKTS